MTTTFTCPDENTPFAELLTKPQEFEDLLNNYYADNIYDNWADSTAGFDLAAVGLSRWNTAPTKPLTESTLFNDTDFPALISARASLAGLSNLPSKYRVLAGNAINEALGRERDPETGEFRDEVVGGADLDRVNAVGAATTFKELADLGVEGADEVFFNAKYYNESPTRKDFVTGIGERVAGIYYDSLTPDGFDFKELILGGFQGSEIITPCEENIQQFFAQMFVYLATAGEIEKARAAAADPSTDPGDSAASVSAAKDRARAKAAAALEIAFAEQLLFQEQCFILGNLVDLVEARKQGTSLALPYTTSDLPDTAAGTGSVPPFANKAINIQGSAFAFTNKLAVSPDQRFLFELNNKELSSITPNMRFYKVDSEPNDGKDVSTEISFDTNFTGSLQQYMSRRGTKRGGRGLGVGVKSFDFSYDGTDPFSAKKAISAKLVLYAPNFSDLLRERTGDNGVKYSYVDLALKTGKYKTDETKAAEKLKETLSAKERDNLDKLNFRLKAQVLWTATKDNLRLFDSEKKDAIYNSAISFYLTPTIHEFDFDETGAVIFTINYLAYIEDYFSQPTFNIFGGLAADKRYRDLTLDYFRQADCKTTGFDEFKKADQQYVTLLNQSSLSKIIRKLRINNLIYYISASKEEMKEWLKNPTSNEFLDKVTTQPEIGIDQNMINEAASKAKTTLDSGEVRDGSGKFNFGAYRLSLVANSDLRENIAFFYLSDLIDAAMSLIEDNLDLEKKTNYYDAVINRAFTGAAAVKNYVDERVKSKEDPKIKATLEQFKKMRIVLGPMEITPYTSKRANEKKMYSGTLGDLPISLNYFLDFMSEKVLSNDFVSYPLSKFVKDVINDCMKNFLNADGCLGAGTSQRVSLNSTTVLAYNTMNGNAEDDLTNTILMGNSAETGWSSRGCLLLNKVPEPFFPLLKISGPNDQRTKLDISTMRNYYIFSIAKRYPVEKYQGDVGVDAQNGIFHYVLGADRGIVKNISLDKTNTPGLKELRFEQEGFDGLTQLREVYNANISTFLNPQTFPGTYIYVDPRGFDPTADEDLSKFGIGGYYMITKTSHKIEPGNAETTINASWVADKGGIAVDQDKDEKKEEDDKKIYKCRIAAISSDGRG